MPTTTTPELRVCMVTGGDNLHVQHRLRVLRECGVAVSHFHGAADAKHTPGPLRALLNATPRLRTLPPIADIARDLRAVPADIVHVQFARRINAWTAAAASDRHLVVSVWGSDIIEDQVPFAPGELALIAGTLRAADLVTVESERMRRRVLELAPHAELASVNWGIDLDVFAAAPPPAIGARLGLPPAARVLYSPRALDPLYNIETIVRALALVVARVPEVHLLQSTSGALEDSRQRVLALAAELGVAERMHLLPFLAAGEVAACYRLADLVINVPRSDGVPRTLFEALAGGTPSVLSNLDCYDEFVQHGVSAWKVAVEAEPLADAIVLLLGDEKRRQAISHAGRQIALATFDYRTQGGLMFEAYRGILARRKHATRAQRLRLAARLAGYRLKGH